MEIANGDFAKFLTILPTLCAFAGSPALAIEYIENIRIPALGMTIEEAFESGRIDAVGAWLNGIEMGGYA